MNQRIYLSAPHMSGEELKYIHEAFDTNWVAPAGPHINKFEDALSGYLNGAYVAALSSGTAAIHLALILLGVSEGDEVFCSSFTFSGSCNPIAYQKAKPVFIDSEEETWNMDPKLLRDSLVRKSKAGIKPKAIIVVHLYGMPAKMDEIMAIAKEFDVPVIEDAAEALGSLYKGQKCGTFGDFGILSFNGNKIITTSGGGALVSKNGDWIEKAKFLATQARDPFPYYHHTHIGYNYRLSNISAGIGLGQMSVLTDRVKRRREIFEYYKNSLSDLKHISFQPEIVGSFSNRWLTCILLNADTGITPEHLRLALEKENIESRPLWKPMHLQPIFENTEMIEGEVSEKLFKNGLCVPSGSIISDRELARIIDLLHDLLHLS